MGSLGMTSVLGVSLYAGLKACSTQRLNPRPYETFSQRLKPLSFDSNGTAEAVPFPNRISEPVSPNAPHNLWSR